MPRAFKLMLAYVAMFVPSLIAAAAIWSFVAPDRFYHCWDDAPFVTFFPPFVHPDFTFSQQLRDYFILPPKTVYSIWLGFVAAAATAPAFPVLAFAWLWRFYERHSKSEFFRTIQGSNSAILLGKSSK